MVWIHSCRRQAENKMNIFSTFIVKQNIQNFPKQVLHKVLMACYPRYPAMRVTTMVSLSGRKFLVHALLTFCSNFCLSSTIIPRTGRACLPSKIACSFCTEWLRVGRNCQWFHVGNFCQLGAMNMAESAMNLAESCIQLVRYTWQKATNLAEKQPTWQKAMNWKNSLDLIIFC